jgi:hypothetical protein
MALEIKVPRWLVDYASLWRCLYCQAYLSENIFWVFATVECLNHEIRVQRHLQMTYTLWLVQRTIGMLRQELEASGEQQAALVQAQTRDTRKLTAALIEADQARGELQVRSAELQGLQRSLTDRNTIIDELRGKLERDVAAVRVRCLFQVLMQGIELLAYVCQRSEHNGAVHGCGSLGDVVSM